jgi:ribosome-associated protein
MLYSLAALSQSGARKALVPMPDLVIRPGLVIAEAELSEQFILASGPGGQNVNKVASAVKLRFDVGKSPSLPEALRAALLGRADTRLDGHGVLTITARRFREQAKNRTDARARLADWIRAGLIPKKPRRATRPSRTVKARRAEAKKHRGRIKKDRVRPVAD